MPNEPSAYCDLMEEIKKRVAGIEGLKASGLPAQVAHESGFLQLRMICELIALASLVAHGDVPAVKSGKLKKHYAADWIINRLAAAHPDFYPRPNKQILDSSGKVSEVIDIEIGYLKKSDLLDLYHRCGSVLHRGSLKNVFDKLRQQERLGEEIDGWLLKIVTLLNHHTIQLFDPDQQFWVLMHGQDGKVHGYSMKKIGSTYPQAT